MKERLEFNERRSMERAMCEVRHKDRNICKDLMSMLGLNEAIDQLALPNSVRGYGHIFLREDDHALRWAEDFEAEGQRDK